MYSKNRSKQPLSLLRNPSDDKTSSNEFTDGSD